MATIELFIQIHEKYFYNDEYSPQGHVVDLQSLNYNDGVVQKAKSLGEFRILSFGDSFCHATVAAPYSYNGVLQQKLLESGRAVRVVNLGEPISSFPQYLATMKNWLPQFEHDMILINIFAINDLGEIVRNDTPEDGHLNRTMGTLFVDSQTGKKRMGHVPEYFPLRVMDYLHAYYHYLTEGAFIPHINPFPYIMLHGSMSQEAYDRILSQDLAICDTVSPADMTQALEYLTRLARLLSEKRTQGTPVLILISPAEIQVNPALFQKAVAAMGADPGRYDLNRPAALVVQAIKNVDPDLDILDLTPLLRQAVANGVNPYYPLDAHWGMVGNRLVGEALAARLRTP